MSAKTSDVDDLMVLYPCCAGLDVHKKTVVACIITTGARGKVNRQVRTFATTTVHLLELSDWLAEHEVSHVAMESTGVYWRPIFNILEATFQVILVNAQHMKAIPGRKTDILDSQWIATLLRHGRLACQLYSPTAHS
jgi:transposase